MAIQFPANPTNGQVYQGYYYDATLSAWKASPVSAGPVAIADVAPTGAIHGDMWYNSLDGSSYVYVNDGTSSQWVEVHSNTAATPGSILQVVSVIKTDVFSTTSTAYTDVAGLSLSITPKLNTSKILVTGNIALGSSTIDRYSVFGRMLRDGTAIGIADTSASARDRGTFSYQMGGFEGPMMQGFSFFDSPATTSAVTYKAQIRTESPQTAYINRGLEADGDTGITPRVISSITLFEVAQ